MINQLLVHNSDDGISGLVMSDLVYNCSRSVTKCYENLSSDDVVIIDCHFTVMEDVGSHTRHFTVAKEKIRL